MKKLFLLIVLAAIGAGAYFVISNPALLTRIEKTPPEISLAESLKGLGTEPVPVLIHLSDGGAGIAGVSAVLQQEGKSLSLGELEFAELPAERSIELELPARPEGFKEGTAVLEISAIDGSLWKNSASISVDLAVDYKRPTIEVLTLQHIGSQGGAEFVAFRASDQNLVEAGAVVGTHKVRAVPLSNLDPAFLSKPDIYAVLLPIPLGYESGDGMSLYARDAVGNKTEAPLRFRIKPKRQNEVNSKLSESFIRRVVFPMLPAYEAMSGEKVDTTADSKEALAEVFKHINQNYRRLLNEKIRKLGEQSAETWLWEGVFIKPMPSATSSTFGEKRSYSLDGVEAGGSRHDGLDLASVARDRVNASGNGKVLYAGELGIYGEAVIIDHGLDLISLYGHLSSVSVDAGQSVAQGQEIGRTGETGLAAGDHLHFEFRVADVPVDPREWWDAHWLKDHIYGKIEFVKERLGIPALSAEAKQES